MTNWANGNSTKGKRKEELTENVSSVRRWRLFNARSDFYSCFFFSWAKHSALRLQYLIFHLIILSVYLVIIFCLSFVGYMVCRCHRFQCIYHSLSLTAPTKEKQQIAFSHIYTFTNKARVTLRWVTLTMRFDRGNFYFFFFFAPLLYNLCVWYYRKRNRIFFSDHNVTGITAVKQRSSNEMARCANDWPNNVSNWARHQHKFYRLHFTNTFSIIFLAVLYGIRFFVLITLLILSFFPVRFAQFDVFSSLTSLHLFFAEQQSW